MKCLSTVLDSRVAKITDGEVISKLFINLEKNESSKNDFFADVFVPHVTRILEEEFHSKDVCLP